MKKSIKNSKLISHFIRRLGLRREEERLAEKQLPDLLEEREEDEKEEKMDDKESGEKREEEEVDVGGLEVPGIRNYVIIP